MNRNVARDRDSAGGSNVAVRNLFPQPIENDEISTLARRNQAIPAAEVVELAVAAAHVLVVDAAI